MNNFNNTTLLSKSIQKQPMSTNNSLSLSSYRNSGIKNVRSQFL